MSAHWIFGYGSLVWRPGFVFEEAHRAEVQGWVRRFWQGSPDHRGTPEAPGRVATLIADPEGHCVGRAFRLAPEVYAATLAPLDHREKAGFERRTLQVTLADGRSVDALTYLATPSNESFLGEAPLDEMAAHIRRSRGPSGDNAEYLLELARWLSAEGVEDPHVEALAALVAG